MPLPEKVGTLHIGRMLTRRSVALGALASPLLARIAFADAAKPLVVFLGNDQCGFCKMWRAQSEPGFKASEAFKKVEYRVVHPATFEAMLQEASWPEDLRWLLTDFEMSDEGAQRGLWTPRFFLAEDKKIVLTVTGNDAWKQKMLPAIDQATGTKA
jgi:hypothetical protein